MKLFCFATQSENKNLTFYFQKKNRVFPIQQKNKVAQKNCCAIFRVDKSLCFIENLNIYSKIRKFQEKREMLVLMLRVIVLRIKSLLILKNFNNKIKIVL